MNWTDYSRVYDLMTNHNPAYREMCDVVLEASHRLAPTGAHIVDVGGGTGNISVTLAQMRLDASVVHVEPDAGMAARAHRKARAVGLSNWHYVQSDLHSWAVVMEPPVDMIIATHVIYAVPDPRRSLVQLAQRLVPGGYLIVCDLGRVLDVRDWAHYLWHENVQRCGVLRTAVLFLRGHAVARHNRTIARHQSAGRYWTHDASTFVYALTHSGFQVDTVSSLYRGCSTFAVARRRA